MPAPTITNTLLFDLDPAALTASQGDPVEVPDSSGNARNFVQPTTATGRPTWRPRSTASPPGSSTG